jgi:ABC-type branched-subunit amino acid transport system substrate-binding protein
MNTKYFTRMAWQKLVQLAGSAAVVASLSTTVMAADVIKLGAPIPLTGPFASDGLTMEKAINLAVDEINQDGGLLGAQVEVVTFDIGDLTPDKLQAAAANLLQREGVDVLVNGYGGMGPDIPAFCPYGVPYLHNDAVTSVVDLAEQMKCSAIFNASDVDTNYGHTVFRQMLETGYDFPSKKLALVHGPYEWDINVANGMSEEAKAAGWEVVFQEEVPYENLEWSGILSKIRAAGPAIVHIEALDPAVATTFIDQFRADPPKGALLSIGYVGSTPGVDDAIRQGNAESVLSFTLNAHRPGQAGDAFVAKWQEAHGEEPPMSLAAAIYDEVKLWAAAVEQVGDAKNYTAVADAIRSMNYDGLIGEFKFNDRNFIDNGSATQPALLFQVQDKKRATLMIGDERVDPIIPPAWGK